MQDLAEAQLAQPKPKKKKSNWMTGFTVAAPKRDYYPDWKEHPKKAPMRKRDD